MTSLQMDDSAVEIVSRATSSTLHSASSPLPTLHKDVVRAQDWEETIKESYQPLQIDPSLWIIPSWAAAEENPSNASFDAALHVLLEPGLAFGTGDHPTTRMCLQWLSSLRDTGYDMSAKESLVMDYGTGSGILAVTALLLGAKEAVGVDVEPLSIKAATQNAVLNDVDSNFKALICSPRMSDPDPLIGSYKKQEFDIVMANILQGPLLELAPRLASYAQPGALLCLSGIMTSQTAAIIERYSEYFDDFGVNTDGTWAMVYAVRKHT